MKMFGPQDFFPSQAGTDNLDLAQIPGCCLITMRKAVITCVVVTHPSQGYDKNARVSLVLYIFSKHGFDCTGKTTEWLPLGK